MKVYKIEIINSIGHIHDTKYYSTLRWISYAIKKWKRNYDVKVYESEVEWKEMD